MLDPPESFPSGIENGFQEGGALRQLFSGRAKMPGIALRQETTGILLIYSSVSSCYWMGTREFGANVQETTGIRVDAVNYHGNSPVFRVNLDLKYAA